MKLTSSAAVLLVCAMVLTLAKFKTFQNQPNADAAPAPPVRKKVDTESVRKPRYGEIAGPKTNKSPAFETYTAENQRNAELAGETTLPGAANQGEPALRNITGITSDERQLINDRLAAASATPDQADDREMMREVHRLATESITSVSNEIDGSLESPTPNP